MTPFTDALNQLGWNPAPEDPAGSAAQVDMYTISGLASKTLAKASQLEDEDADQAYFRSTDIILYILAETAQRRDDEYAFMPVPAGLQRRQLAEKRLRARHVHLNVHKPRGSPTLGHPRRPRTRRLERTGSLNMTNGAGTGARPAQTRNQRR